MQDIESLAQGRSPGFQSTASGIALILNRGVARVQKMGNAIPPSSLIVLSSFAVQVGTAWAKTLFETGLTQRH